MKNKSSIQFQPISDDDNEFLYQVYRSTREDEIASAGWSEQEIEQFLRMQFQFQNAAYFKDYHNATFNIILYKNKPAGRLYLDRRDDDIRIIDIALLTEYRRKGIGTFILKNLMKEARHQKSVLSLHVEHNNPAMILYETLGFEKKDSIGVYHLMEYKPA